MSAAGLRPPFPYFGGKRRFAAAVWDRFGQPDVYAEPFCGSAAVLLARPALTGRREVICDLDGGVSNFWRAIRFGDPEEVARWATWPTIHQDLTARHKWLVDWFAEHRTRLSEDPDYYDTRVAGWWVWGISNWIGGGWCHTVSDKQPAVSTRPGGRRVQAQSTTVHNKRPYVSDRADGARGVQAQTHAARTLVDWFGDLAERLNRVVVLNCDWTAAVTPTVLANTPTGTAKSVAVFLDPPYLTSARSSDLYRSDAAEGPDRAAIDSYEWAVEHGDRYRIAYACHNGDFPAPAGWETLTSPFQGVRTLGRRDREDMVMFSPACRVPQPTLF